MVARVRPERELAVIFSRDGEDPETKIVPTGKDAMEAAIIMIATRKILHDGDRLAVSFYDET